MRLAVFSRVYEIALHGKRVIVAVYELYKKIIMSVLMDMQTETKLYVFDSSM